MKTLKYRSAFAGLMVATLSVFLFTACEKESDGPTQEASIDRMSKFERLTFTSGGTSTSTSSSSSGTFAGGGGSISFASGGSDNSFDLMGTNSFADVDSDIEFTDPLDQGPVYGIDLGDSDFSFGSGNLKVDSDMANMLVVCGEFEGFMSFVNSLTDSVQSTAELNIIVGIEEDMLDGDGTSGNVVYVFQYGNASSPTLGNESDLNNGNVEGLLFAFVVSFDSEETNFLWLESATTVDIDGGKLVGDVSDGMNSIPFEFTWSCN